MGLLSSKTRIMDTILTDEGRRQLISGKFVPMFYSFSDNGAVYSPLDTFVSGTVPETTVATAVAFEAFPLPQDQVAYEADDSGGLRVFGNNNYFQMPTGENVRVIGGKLVQGWATGQVQVLSASAQFSSMATSVLSGTTDNFRRLMILKSPDLLHPDRDDFRLNITGGIEFHVRNDTLLPGDVTKGVLETSDNMFSDRRLSHLDNFSFLPPINKRTDASPVVKPIGNYAGSINGNRQILSYSDLQAEFQHTIVKSGSLQQRSLLQKQTITFAETTMTNRLVGQMFEVADGVITKLDVVDFGVFTVKKTDPPLFPDAIPTPLNTDLVTATSRIHVYFVGKIFLDASGNHKFINMFSLCFN